MAKAKKQGEIPAGLASNVRDLGGGVLDPELGVRLDKLPVNALMAAARAMKEGMKYEANVVDNWKEVPAEEHLNHGMRHALMSHDGDRSEPHVGHAVSRFLMWAHLKLKEGAE